MSDDEDVTRARDVLVRKRLEKEAAGEKAKKNKERENGRKRRARKRPLDNRCVFCKQLKQVGYTKLVALMQTASHSWTIGTEVFVAQEWLRGGMREPMVFSSISSLLLSFPQLTTEFHPT